MSLKNCEPCSNEINQYEDDYVCSLITWLEAVTCLQWIRAFPDGSRPEDQDAKGNDQYGVVEVNTISPRAMRLKEAIAVGESEACIRLQGRAEIRVTLRVYKDLILNRSTGTSIRTTGDMLLRIYDAYHIPSLQKLLFESGVSLLEEGFSDIVNIKTELKGVYESSSVMDVMLCVDRRSSVAEDAIIGYYLKSGDDCGEEDKNCD